MKFLNERLFFYFNKLVYLAAEPLNLQMKQCLKLFLSGLIFVFVWYSVFGLLNIFDCVFVTRYFNSVMLDFAGPEWFERLGNTATSIANHYCSIVFSRHWLTQKLNLNSEQIEFLLLMAVLFDNFATYDDMITIVDEFGKFQDIFNKEFYYFFFLREFYGYGLIIKDAPEPQLCYDYDFDTYKLVTVKQLLKASTSVAFPQFEKLLLQPQFIDIYWTLLIWLSFISLFAKGENEFAYYFYVGLCEFLVTQLFFIEISSFLIKKKVLLFFLLNFILIVLMFWNLIRLSNAINLIYALLHFLVFAVLSGLLIILWGATYIGFCVLLIYAAAIPVLALYIIMLVNVDLIQWLFFIEHINYNSKRSWFKRFILLLIFFFFLFYSFKEFDFSLATKTSSLNDELTKNLFFLLLAKRFINTLNFSYSTENIFDLVTSFYYSDIDKVASAAFKVSSNELIALVLLLLIAVIVVISISRTSTINDKFFYQSTNVTISDFYQALTFWHNLMLWRFVRIAVARILLGLNHPFTVWGVWENFVHDPMFLYILRLDVLDARPKDRFDLQRLLLEPATILDPYDPWKYWYMKYETDHIQKELEADPLVVKILPYGPQNRTLADEYIEIAKKGILD